MFGLYAALAACGTLLSVVYALPTSSQRVHTSSGVIQGHFSTWQKEVTEYLGVPYAKVPVGPYRWAAPEPYNPPTSGAFTASKYVRHGLTFILLLR